MFRYDRLNELVKEKGIKKAHLCRQMGTSLYYLRDAEKGNADISEENVSIIADCLGVDPLYLTGESDIKSAAPTVTEDIVSFPVLGEVAAGYDHLAYEDVTDDKVDVPRSWLRGRSHDEYFTLRVSGDSMYPEYQDGDIVLVLKQSTMNRSGQIGVVMYDDDKATLKRVEYVMGEDWMKLSPINPMYAPVMVKDEQLEHCRILGIPRYVIREVQN